ncbi:ABC transporter substrate-binding protein [Thermodesulfobacteriota bacterium]
MVFGALQNPKAPEGNVTGVTYFVPIGRIFDVIKQCFPNAKSVGFLGEKGHPGTIVDQKGTSEEAEARGLKYYEAICSTPDEVRKAAGDLAKKADLLIVSNQALINSNVSTILEVANQAKKPLVSYVEKPVKSGAVLGISVDHDKLGTWLADSVAEVPVKGKSIKDVPVKSEPNPIILVNPQMMEFLGLNFPPSVMGKAKTVD